MTTLCNDLTMPTRTAQPDLFARAQKLLATWRQRRTSRSELMIWDQRDLHDAGITAYDIQMEADKPFWRA